MIQIKTKVLIKIINKITGINPETTAPLIADQIPIFRTIFLAGNKITFLIGKGNSIIMINLMQRNKSLDGRTRAFGN